MEIRYLQTFITIIEQGGFTKAAEHLGYAQSTITAHIKILENEIGEGLFDRLGKKVVLTHMGERLVPYARQMLEIYKEMQLITASEGEVVGDLIIGASESLTIYRLAEVLKTYKQRFPKVNIILKTGKCSELRQRLYRGELHMTLTIEPEIIDSDLVVKCLGEERMVIVGTSESELTRANIILSEQGCRARAVFEEYLHKHQIKYANPLELSSLEAIKKCVMSGLGVSLLPYYTVALEVQDGKLKPLECAEPIVPFKTQVCYHKNKSISSPMRQLLDMLA
ncbi:MAG: LysR family transcriptional regulator [Cellulosilyticaceae bacterium]